MKDFLPATWRGTTSVGFRFGEAKIGVSFDLVDMVGGRTTRLLLSVESARNLAESIRESLQENGLRTSVQPDRSYGISSAEKSAPLDGEKV